MSLIPRKCNGSGGGWVPYVNIWSFPLTVSGQVLTKILKKKKKKGKNRTEPQVHLSSVSELVPSWDIKSSYTETSIYKALSILYPTSFFLLCLFFPFLFSLFPWACTSLFTPFALISANPRLMGLAESVHPEIGFSDDKERASNKAVLQDRNSRGWWVVIGAKPEEGECSPLWGS